MSLSAWSWSFTILVLAVSLSVSLLLNARMESHSGRIPEFEHTHANSSLDDDQHLREESSVMASRWNEIGRILSVSTCVIPATVVLAAIAVRLKRQIWALNRECLLLVLCPVSCPECNEACANISSSSSFHGLSMLGLW